MGKALTTAIIFTLVGICHAEGFVLTVDSVIDGDTIKAGWVVREETIDLGSDLILYQRVTHKPTTIRLADFDAWESTRVRFGNLTSNEELIRGAKAKVDLQALLKSATSAHGIQVNKSGRDFYNRILFKLLIIDSDGKAQDIAELMRGMGHARDSLK